jgi:hypothetical protein
MLGQSLRALCLPPPGPRLANLDVGAAPRHVGRDGDPPGRPQRSPACSGVCQPNDRPCGTLPGRESVPPEIDLPHFGPTAGSPLPSSVKVIFCWRQPRVLPRRTYRGPTWGYNLRVTKENDALGGPKLLVQRHTRADRCRGGHFPFETLMSTVTRVAVQGGVACASWYGWTWGECCRNNHTIVQ